MIKIFFICIAILLNISYAKEVSIFGAGNLSDKNPYGLDADEKEIYKTKKQVKQVDKKIDYVKTSVSSLNDRIDGLESSYDGDSRKLHNVSVQLQKSIKDIKDIKKILNQLLVMQDQIAKQNQDNITNLKTALLKVTKQVNLISKNQNSRTKKSNKKTKKQKNKTSNATLLKRAKFLVRKKSYKKARQILLRLVKKKYKRATSNFYLGEIEYKRKKCKNAISYYKTSALVYAKASYMPQLLYHSAVCFEKIGDIDNATIFYSTLLEKYPKSKEAKIVKKKL